MKYGFVFPQADIKNAIKCVKLAEKKGWDGFFIWEPIYGIDAWVTLSALSLNTSKIRLGTLLSPISRMRPWKVASEAITIDILSKGRLNIAVGLGAVDTGFAEFGEATDLKTRAELLDEGLDIMVGLWQKNLPSYGGKQYRIGKIQDLDFFKRHPMPELVQKPRIPIWVVGAWPYAKSMNRTLKYDGIIPTIKNKDGSFEQITPQHIKEIKKYIKENHQGSSKFDIIVEGETPGDDFPKANTIIEPFTAAGATWWIESNWLSTEIETVMKRIDQGPPKRK